MGDRVQELFDQAVALPGSERAAFLDAACRGDSYLRAEVASLLAADAGFAEGAAEGLLQSPLVRPPRPPGPSASGDPAAVASPQGGRYRILRRLAEGGMGTVYEAEQDSPRRLVALKVARPGAPSPGLRQRFAHEVEILGRLDHPAIAQLYEAGLTEDGQPFFAMELVRGQPLTEYARRQSLPLPARLDLLARVCDAVQHAHDHGVVHRDLKPANILVDDAGRPRLLDFGVARLLHAGRPAAGLTQTGHLLGTLPYMSPEQVAARPGGVDHRADVYALGVILFELVAGRLPYCLDEIPLAEAARVIRDEDPPRLGSLCPEGRGAVETIAARALEKEPARRYPSAAALGADLRQAAGHKPIRARPPSARDSLRKFARRHTALVAGAAATGAALLLGLVVSLFFAFGEARQRRLADASAAAARQEKHEALVQAYRARIASAAAALAAHDVADARRQLDAAPDDLRGWEWRHLRSRLDDSSAVLPLPDAIGALLTGAPERIRVSTLTPAGVRVADLEGGASRTVPVGPDRGSHVAAVPTRRGLRVAAWVGPTTIHLLDGEGRVLSRTEVPQARRQEPIAVSPDGVWLATHWEDGEWRRLAVFDAASGRPASVCAGHRDGIWNCAFSPDGTRLATAGEDRAARLWDPCTGKLLADCQGHTGKVLGVAFSPDGSRLVTAAADGTVRQWDAATGREVEAPYDRHAGEVAAAVYSPDGAWVASAGTDRTVRVWRASGRQDVAVLHGHGGPVVRLAFAPGGRRLASLSLTWIFSAGDDTVRVWDVDPQAPLPVLRGHARAVYPVAFSPDGRRLASGGWDATVRLWDAATGEPLATLPHPGVVPDLAYGPDGAWLVTGTYGDDRLRIWDAATGRVRRAVAGPAGQFRQVKVSPDGERLAATAYAGGGAHRWQVSNTTSGEALFAAEGRALAYSPDGRWLAALAADEQTLLLLDARTHATAARLEGHDGTVNAAAFSADSWQLASCGRDGSVRLWSVDGGAGRVLRGHTDEVFAAAFHPDGTRLATAGRDRAVWLWDTARGEEVARLPGHASYVWSLAFSPDGQTLASGSGDGTVRLWDTVPLKARHQARRAAAAAATRIRAEQRAKLLK